MRKQFLLAMVLCVCFLGIFSNVSATVPAYPDLSVLEDLPYTYGGYTYTDRIVYLSSPFTRWVCIDFKAGTDFNPSVFNTGGYWEVTSGAVCSGSNYGQCLTPAASSNIRRRTWYSNQWGTSPPKSGYFALSVSESWANSIIWSTQTVLFVPYSSSYCTSYLPPNYTQFCHDQAVNGIVNPPIQKQLTVALDPTEGGSVASLPDGVNPSCGTGGNICCGYLSGYCWGDCQMAYGYGSQVILKAFPSDGWAFQYWSDGTNQYSQNPLAVTMNGAKSLTAVFKIPEATDFVYPVLASGVTDPLQNKTNPIGNGWYGYGVGAYVPYHADGHLGQDYVLDGANSAGQPVYAVADGIVEEVLNGPGTYGWCDNEDHGWGPVVVIRHERQSGFNTTDAFIASNCVTETATSPTVVYSHYGHLSKASIQNITVGQIVYKGDQIGVLGSAGTDWSNDLGMVAHLHFEIKDTVGFNEGNWYAAGHYAECPGSNAYIPCTGCEVYGVGTAYSHGYNFAPHRYKPEVFIPGNQQ